MRYRLFAGWLLRLGALWALLAALISLSIAIGQRSEADLLAYSAHDSRGLNIFLYDTQTGLVAPITRDGKNNRHPQWTPDGNALIFSSSGLGEDGERHGVYIVDADGRHRRPLYQPPTRTAEGLEDSRLPPLYSVLPPPHPDAQWAVVYLYYTFNPNPSEPPPARLYWLNTHNPTSLDPIQQTQTLHPSTALMWDGADALRYVVQDGTQFTLYQVMPPDDTPQVVQTWQTDFATVSFSDPYPALLPDGDGFIVLARRNLQYMQLYRFDTAHDDPIQLTDTAINKKNQMMLSADGRWVAYMTQPDELVQPTLHIINALTGAPRIDYTPDTGTLHTIQQWLDDTRLGLSIAQHNQVAYCILTLPTAPETQAMTSDDNALNCPLPDMRNAVAVQPR